MNAFLPGEIDLGFIIANFKDCLEICQRGNGVFSDGFEISVLIEVKVKIANECPVILVLGRIPIG